MKPRQVIRPVALLAVVLALLVSLAACGSEDGSSGTAADTSTASSDAPSSTPTPDQTVTSVTVLRSGGKTGRPVKTSFTADGQPPEGFDAARQEQVLAVAQQVVDAGIRMPELPTNTCCDRYLYTVAIGFADGTSATFSAVDGERIPAAFQELLTQLS